MFTNDIKNIIDLGFKDKLVSNGVLLKAESILAQSRKRPKASLTKKERNEFRKARIYKADLSRLQLEKLLALTTLTPERAQELTSIYHFQKLRSVGPATAEDLFELGYNTPSDLAGEHPLAMYIAHSAIVKYPVDRCVEDVFRCAVAQVEIPSFTKTTGNWWFWTPYRGQTRLPSVKLIKSPKSN